MDVLVTYDIATRDKAGERRLARVAAVCERYGRRVQYSVFELRVSDITLQRLLIELEDEIDSHVDSVHVYRIPGTLVGCRLVLGRAVPRHLGQPWIL